jgi:hypothetical protein
MNMKIVKLARVRKYLFDSSSLLRYSRYFIKSHTTNKPKITGIMYEKAFPKLVLKPCLFVIITRYNMKKDIIKSTTNLIAPQNPSECGLSLIDLVYPSQPEIINPQTKSNARKFIN